MVSDLLNYCQMEHETKTRIREEQAEGRRLRLEEKRLMAERLANPPPAVSQVEQKKAKGQGGQYGSRGKKSEVEPEPEPEPLPYLPTPDEIILTNEGLKKKLNEARIYGCRTKNQISHSLFCSA